MRETPVTRTPVQETPPLRPRRLVLLGHPVAHSLSPLFQQAALDHLGIPLRYTAQDVVPEALAETLSAMRAESAAGNITVPHKQAALSCCDVVTPLAQRVGAVNTFWTDAQGQLHGDNTDVAGFEAAVAKLLQRDVAGVRMLVLGAGGAALALREAVRGWPGAQLLVHARREDQAQQFAAPLAAQARAVALSAEVCADVDLVVNTTPLGLHANDPSPVAPELLGRDVAVLDLTYRRDGPTAWVSACRARGLRADDGLLMLVEQGALAFERWFGIAAPRDVMRAAIGR